MVDAPLERVWGAVTKAWHLAKWFGDARAEIDLRPCGTMTNGTVHGVVEREELHLFAYRWGRPSARSRERLREFKSMWIATKARRAAEDA